MSQAADRTLILLEHVARASGPMGLLEIAGRTGLDKTTCSRLLGLLVARGWLVRDTETKKYSVGPTLVGISMSASLPDQVRLHFFPLLHELREASGETVSLQRRFGTLRVCVAGLESQHSLRRSLPIGSSMPLSAGPSGKAILAFADTETTAAAFAGLEEARHQTVHDHLGQIRRTGYLSTDGDRTPGVGAIAAPLFDRGGVYGSLTLAGPSSRFDAAARQAMLPMLLRAARDLTVLLGGDTGRYDGWTAANPPNQL
ncbi:IclR family transcriptional regulator [Actinoallomurus oryzae]|uniref:IclR family transcriptional regulator n=1 Tax=Actinoallomurus oryzae TaxID=502180 RepID=A0ABP8PUE1_9ACTN